LFRLVLADPLQFLSFFFPERAAGFCDGCAAAPVPWVIVAALGCVAAGFACTVWFRPPGRA
jgi:hypothetical protein